MARLLNSLIVGCCFVCCFSGLNAQTDAESVQRPPDFQDQDQFKHFNKRRKDVAKWQINQLKNGALLVRLHNNKFLAEQLRKKGLADLAIQKEHEAIAVNQNTVRAFSKYYTFSKVYFFYSEFSDTLLKGARSGIFLDSSLQVDPAITLKENFYLLAEKDVVYNSSIGFVKEDTASFIKETGPGTKEFAIVLKNKYSHQLKEPFPYTAPYNAKVQGGGSRVVQIIKINGISIPVEIHKRNSFPKHVTYVQGLNMNLLKFYQANKDYVVKDESVKPFLY
jgi:hypothetical protein